MTKDPRPKFDLHVFSLLCILLVKLTLTFLLKPLETKLISETSSVCQAEQVARVIVRDAIVSKLLSLTLLFTGKMRIALGACLGL